MVSICASSGWSGGGKRAAGAIYSAMFEAALGGVGVVGPVALHPLQIGQARAIDELVDHAGRHEVGEGAVGHINGATPHAKRGSDSRETLGLVGMSKHR